MVGAAQSLDSIYMVWSLPDLGRQTLTLAWLRCGPLSTADRQQTVRMEPG